MKKETPNVTNTRTAKKGLHLALPGAIEAQEAQGQRELVTSLQLPRKCNSPHGYNATEQYHRMGIRTLTASKGDDLFIGVRLPIGWYKEGSDHDMWSYLVDAKGQKRASIFYKAAFYDRDAFVNFEKRYEWRGDYSITGKCSYVVKDQATGQVVFKSESMDEDYSASDYFKRQDELQCQCKNFLSTNFPDHENVNAYWD